MYTPLRPRECRTALALVSYHMLSCLTLLMTRSDRSCFLRPFSFFATYLRKIAPSAFSVSASFCPLGTLSIQNSTDIQL